MSFASPAWLLLLLLAGVIAFLHSRPRRNVEVGSLHLWRQLELAVPPKSTHRLPVPNLLLILQLLAFALVVLALARPLRGGGEPPLDHWIVLLDASASMGAQVGGASPFDDARDHIASRLTGAGDPPARLTLVTVGVSPIIQAARVTRPESLLDALDTARPAHTAADWTRVPGMLRGLSRADERARVTVLTDAAGRALATAALEEMAGAEGGRGSASATGDPANTTGPDLELITFGAPAANLSLAAVEPTLLDPATGLWRVAGEIHLTGPAPNPVDAPVEVRIFFEPAVGEVVRPLPDEGPEPGQAGPPEPTREGLAAWAAIEVDLDPTGFARFEQTIALPGAGLIEVRLPDDALAHDNARRFVVRDAPRTARVLYVGASDIDLILAFDAIPEVTVARAASVPASLEGFDLLVMDGPATGETPGISTVWIGSAPGSVGATALSDPMPGGWTDEHPLSESVDWGSLQVRDARQLPLLPGAVAIVEAAGGHPLVQARTTEHGREVALAFRPADTDWPDQLGFPAFVSNLVLWAVPDLGRAVEPPCRAGSSCPLTSARLTGDWRLLSPDGDEIPLPRQSSDAGASPVDLRAGFVPAHGGVYRLVSGNVTRPIAVNAANGVEADLSAPEGAGSDDRFGGDVQSSAPLPIRGWLLGLALLTLLVEAWIAARRGERFLRLEALRSANPLANRRRAVLGLRIGAAVLLVLAILDPRTPLPSRSAGVVLVIDESMAADAFDDAGGFVADASGAAGRGRRLGVVRVGSEGTVRTDLDPAPVRADGTGAPEAEPAADLESAIRLAAAMLPRETGGRIALVGDGAQTRGAVDAALPDILARGIPIDVHPLPGPARDVAVESLSLPAPVHPNERAPLRTTVRSDAAMPATLRLFRDGEALAERTVELRPGANRVDFEISEEATGDYLYEVEVAGVEGDARSVNDRGGLVVAVREPPRVAIVTPQAAWGRTFAEALAAQGMGAEVFPPAGAPGLSGTADPSLAGFDALALMNVPASDLPEDRAGELEAWVREGGGGLVLMGGENTFGPGGYFDSPLEALSPLSAKIPQELPNLAIIFVLDRSSSMGESVGDGTRLDLVKVATLDAIELLDPETQVGVVAFDLSAYNVVPLQPAGNREAIRDQIERLETGGGTWIYTGLGLGFVELSKVDPEFRRHIVLMSDGRSQPANYELLMGLIDDAGMTVSTAAIGSGADAVLMERLARLGNGAAHVTNDFQDLPSILAREASRFSSNAVREEAVEPVRSGDESGRDSPFGDGPPALGGFVRTTPKPGAQVHLEAGEDIPLLASWRYGLGRVVAFASQGAGAWSTEWMESAEYSAWWAQTVRWAIPAARSGLNLRLSRERDYGRIVVERVGDAPGEASGVPLEATVRAPDGAPLPALRLTERSPGVYEGRFVADQPGTYRVAVTSPATAILETGPVEGSLHVAFPARFALADPDTELMHALADATGGRVLESGEQIFDTPTPLRWIGRSAWPFWALLALGVFLLELLFRYSAVPSWLARPLARWRAAEAR